MEKTEQHKLQEYYEVNDIVPVLKNKYKIVPKNNPRLIGWGCSCGFTSTSQEEVNLHKKNV